jgi:glycosyltransferase involved in cell wall biosynthesis
MSDPLSVLMLSIEYPPVGGGASPVARGLARALAERGHRVHVVTMGHGALAGDQMDAGVRVIRVPSLRARIERSRLHELAAYTLLGACHVRKLAARHAYDVCHAQFVLPTGCIPYALRAQRGFPPYVVTAHGTDVPGHNPHRFTLLHRFTPPLIRSILRRAAAVIVPSAAMHRLLRDRFGAVLPALRRIPNAVDADRFAAGPKDALVLVASRLNAGKGVHRVVEALAATPGNGYQLEVAGEGPERAGLERLARERRVPARFHGWLARDNLDRLFERSRIFVLASSAENFPVSLLEAMAARCAVVATRVGGIPEVLGDAGMLVDPDDPRGLAEALRSLMQSPELAADLGRRAGQRVRARFGWGEIVGEHEALYRAAAAGRVA